jgi:dTDP-L-rhamnose 4-epimerase
MTPGSRFDKLHRKYMHIVVTGGAGFIGSYVVDRLVADGHRVTILDSLAPQVHPHGPPAYLNPSAELLVGDIRNRDALARALVHADAVVHCASAVGVAQSQYEVAHYTDVNVHGTGLLLELLMERRRELKRLVVFTSMTQYGEGMYRRPSTGARLRVPIRSEPDVERYGWEPVAPDDQEVLEAVPTPEDADLQASNVYALTKRYQEELSRSLGAFYQFPVVCLRLFNVYGPRQSLSNPYTGVLAIFLSRLLAGESPLVYEDGRQTRDFVSVHDVVEAAVLSLRSDAAVGQILNIGSGQPRSIAECAAQLATLLGRPGIEPTVTGRFRRGDIRHCTADLTRARRLLDYRVGVSWEQGLAELIRWAQHAPSEDRTDQAQRELYDRGIIKK